ncbi:DUF3857 domain-containing protein [Puia sp.]|uniref:DUF3857 domain-containing protein n=1 Tax=Puia sp. TaxID=2045100 RepID=UPI002F4020EC
MFSKLYSLSFVLLAVIAGQSVHAQADTVKYKERAAAVNQEVWGWKLPAFASHTVPAGYAGESSVILARRAVIEADSKKKMDWAVLGARRNFYYNSTVRELVKINDKASLEEYSQLNFRQFKKLNGWISGTATTFVGARIIKPDGSVRQISIDESVILRTDKDDLERKLAIADLQVGDLLDYYVRVEEWSVALREPERLIFVFGDDHPILHYSIHCEIGDKYAVEYRSMNKAPDARQSANEDKDLVLDLELHNIPAAPTGLWMSSLRELPAFRINVLAGGRLATGRSNGDVIKDAPLSDVIRRSWVESNPQLAYMIIQQVEKIVRAADKHYYTLSKDSLAYLVYYAYRFNLYYNQVEKDMIVGEGRNHMEMKTDLYLSCLGTVFNRFKIKYHIVALPSRYGPDMRQVMIPGDLVHLLQVDVDKPFYITNDNMFTCPGYIPDYLEGQPCVDINSQNGRRGAQPNLTNLTPLSAAADNIHRENLHINISGDDMQSVRVKRQTTLTGRMKEGEQLHLLNFEDCYESERNTMHVEKSIMDDLKKARKSKNVSEDYATALQKARESLKDRFKEEVSSEFEENPKEMISWKVDNPGLRHSAPDLVYSTEFTMDGLLQRAGNNILLSIGKTVSSPLKLTSSQRTRKVDIYMPYARTIDYSVSFAIPQGFTVQGADKLNRTLENDCGSLTTAAKIEGGQLVLHFKRVYKHNEEPAAKWPQLLAILDASTEFAGQKVLLKKG